METGWDGMGGAQTLGTGERGPKRLRVGRGNTGIRRGTYFRSGIVEEKSGIPLEPRFNGGAHIPGVYFVCGPPGGPF